MFKPTEEEWTPLPIDNIFHENGPKFIEERLKTDFSDVDLVLISALANQLWYNRPDDDVREEMLRPYVLALTKHEDRNWLVCHQGQIWRCRNEFLRSKTKEKSLVYLQGLIDHFRTQDVTMAEKFEFAFGLNYPQSFLFKKELASKF
jgi:hypothetical protein